MPEVDKYSILPSLNLKSSYCNNKMSNGYKSSQFYVDNDHAEENIDKKTFNSDEDTLLNQGKITDFCCLCNKWFSDEQMLHEHSKSVHQNSFKCTECSDIFNSNFNLLQHRRIHLLFFCQICNRSFKFKSNLIRHRKVHADTNRYECKICFQSFKTELILKRHLVAHADFQLLFKCDECGKLFNAQHKLKIHKNVHSNVKKFVCEICNKNFKFKSALCAHVKKHSTYKEYLCELCGKEFTYAQGLFAHRVIHFNEKTFECDYCEKKFMRKETLKHHIKIHLNIKDFCCHICGRGFVMKQQMMVHSRHCVRTKQEPNNYFVSKTSQVKIKEEPKETNITNDTSEEWDSYTKSRDNCNTDQIYESNGKVLVNIETKFRKNVIEEVKCKNKDSTKKTRTANKHTKRNSKIQDNLINKECNKYFEGRNQEFDMKKQNCNENNKKDLQNQLFSLNESKEESNKKEEIVFKKATNIISDLDKKILNELKLVLQDQLDENKCNHNQEIIHKQLNKAVNENCKEVTQIQDLNNQLRHSLILAIVKKIAKETEMEKINQQVEDFDARTHTNHVEVESFSTKESNDKPLKYNNNNSPNFKDKQIYNLNVKNIASNKQSKKEISKRKRKGKCCEVCNCDQGVSNKLKMNQDDLNNKKQQQKYDTDKTGESYQNILNNYAQLTIKTDIFMNKHDSEDIPPIIHDHADALNIKEGEISKMMKKQVRAYSDLDIKINKEINAILLEENLHQKTNNQKTNLNSDLDIKINKDIEAILLEDVQIPIKKAKEKCNQLEKINPEFEEQNNKPNRWSGKSKRRSKYNKTIPKVNIKLTPMSTLENREDKKKNVNMEVDKCSEEIIKVDGNYKININEIHAENMVRTKSRRRTVGTKKMEKPNTKKQLYNLNNFRKSQEDKQISKDAVCRKVRKKKATTDLPKSQQDNTSDDKENHKFETDNIGDFDVGSKSKLTNDCHLNQITTETDSLHLAEMRYSKGKAYTNVEEFKNQKDTLTKNSDKIDIISVVDINVNKDITEVYKKRKQVKNNKRNKQSNRKKVKASKEITSDNEDVPLIKIKQKLRLKQKNTDESKSKIKFYIESEIESKSGRKKRSVHRRSRRKNSYVKYEPESKQPLNKCNLLENKNESIANVPLKQRTQKLIVGEDVNLGHLINDGNDNHIISEVQSETSENKLKIVGEALSNNTTEKCDILDNEFGNELLSHDETLNLNAEVMCNQLQTSSNIRIKTDSEIDKVESKDKCTAEFANYSTVEQENYFDSVMDWVTQIPNTGVDYMESWQLDDFQLETNWNHIYN